MNELYVDWKSGQILDDILIYAAQFLMKLSIDIAWNLYEME